MVGTDETCTWDKPRKQSEPFKLAGFHYGQQELKRELFKPNVTEIDSIPQRELEKSIKKMVKVPMH